MSTLARTTRDAGWRERGATLTMFLALGLGIGTWAAALPRLKAVLALSDGDLSLALLTVAVASTVATVVVGTIAPRFGTGRSTGVAAVAVVTAVALPALAGTLAQLVAAAVAIGASMGALDISVNGHAGEIERRWRSPIMSSFHAAFSVGGLAGSAIGGALAGAGFSLAGQMWLPLGVAFALVAVATPFLGPGARSTPAKGLGLALPDRAAAGLCAVTLFCFLIEGAMADWSGVYLSTVAQASAAQAAAGYGAFSLAMAGGRLVGDGAVRTLGARRVLVAGGVLAAAGMALALLVPAPLPIAVGFALVGIGAANVVPVTFSAAGRFGSSPTAGMAMMATVGYAGFMGGPPLIGAVATAVGLRGALGLLLVAALLVALGGRSRGLDAPPR